MAAIEVMVSHCQDPLTIEEIARAVGVSEDHLSRVFRETFGRPAAAYYTRLRIAVACRLLRETVEKMESVAHRWATAVPRSCHGRSKT
jgi:AraC family transcriptional regulator